MILALFSGERDRHVAGVQVVPSPQPAVDNERYTRFPPPRAPKGDHLKPYHVRFDTRATPTRDSSSANQRQGSRSATPSQDPHPANQRTVSFSPSVRSSPGPSLFSARPSSREGSFSSSTFRDVSFTPVPQHSPQRTLSTFSSPSNTASFTTFQKARGTSQQSATSVDDDASTTTSGSYTVNPEELRIEGYIGADVIV